VVFGPGAFNFPDTQAGLVDLTSYKATLTLSFDGTRAGNTEQWSKTYVMLTVKEPAARQLTIEKTGDLSDLAPLWLVEAHGAAYELGADNGCLATVIDTENSLGLLLEPAGFLTGIHGAQAAGSETVNGVAADHYTLDESALGQVEIVKSTGELLVVSQGGYIIKYVLTTKGDSNYFGEGIDGTLTWDYELTDVNQTVAIQLPEDCPPGKVNAPLLPDAYNVQYLPDGMTYGSDSSLADATAFFQAQIPDLGWEPLGDPSINEKTVQLDFTQGDQRLSVLLTAGDGGTTVLILLGSSH